MKVKQGNNFFILRILNTFQNFQFHKCRINKISPWIIQKFWLLNLFYSNNEVDNVHSKYSPINTIVCPMSFIRKYRLVLWIIKLKGSCSHIIMLVVKIYIFKKHKFFKFYWERLIKVAFKKNTLNFEMHP